MIKMKWIRKILSIATVLLMVFALAPTKVEAFSDPSVYSDPSTGIDISLREGWGASTNNKTVTFTVIVDGVTVEPGKTISEIPTYSGYVDVNAPGYDVTYSTTGALTIVSDGGLLTFNGPGEGSGTCTINLASSVTKRDTEIGEYGVFSWSKQHAGTSAYTRNIEIYVNGVYQYIQSVNTPETLSNIVGANQEFWFTPSEDYNANYDMDKLVLDTVSNQTLRIDLTTKCKCGLDTCLCPGGCDCVEGCTCPECTGGTLADNQINTGYGILTYKEPGLSGGYNLTVRINLNGEIVYTSDPLRVYGGLPGNLIFEPTEGKYFYQKPNDYDISTLRSGSTWSEGTGQLSIVGVSQEVRDFDNVLTINLVSFENKVTLDVERRAGAPLNNVIGYRVSYTLDGVDYSYDYNRFEAAQAPNIPTNVPVTITAICESGFEVNEWSTGNAHAGNVTLEGSKGEDGTWAFGNSVTLKVNSAGDTTILLYVENLNTVKVPTEEELLDPEGILKDGAVTIDCINEAVNHESKTYGLIADTFTIGELKGNSADGYTVDVTITNPQAYADEYDEGHTLVEGQGEKVIALQWNSPQGAWEPVPDTSPVVYNVDCEIHKPTDEEVGDLLAAGAVTIDCVNDEAGHEDKTYTPIADSYTIGEVEKDEDTGVYTSAITFKNEKYVDSYNTDVASGHTLNDGEEASKTINFVWNSDEQKWEVESNGSPVTFEVICKNGGGEEPGTEDPDKPTLEEIDELLPDTLVSVDCITDENHADQTYNLIENAITIGDVEGDADKGYTSTVTFAAKGYVDQYSTDMKKDHTLAEGQPTEHKLVFVWDAANQKWQPSIGTATPLVFQVECDTTTEPGTDEPGTEDPENPDDEKPGDDQQGTENPDDQKPGDEQGSGDQDGQGTGDKTDGSQDGDKNGGTDSGKQDSTKGDGTKTSASLGVSLFGSLASVSATGAALLSVFRRKRR